MSTLVQHMTHAAMAERLIHLAIELQAAAEEADLARVSRADHAFRSAVIGLVGGATLMEDHADWRLEALIDSLEKVKAASATLSRKMRAQQTETRGKLVYLTLDKKGR